VAAHARKTSRLEEALLAITLGLGSRAIASHRGDIVCAPEGPHEASGISVAGPPADLHGKIGLDQQTPRLGHAPAGRSVEEQAAS
jgi:hypothetical protein